MSLRQDVDHERIKLFLKKLGESFHRPGRLNLKGTSAFWKPCGAPRRGVETLSDII